MSANLALTKIKLGDSATPANNFLISVPDIADGTLTIEREDGTDVLTIDAAGKVVFPGNVVPAFSAYATSGATLSSGVAATLVFQAEEFDTASCFDTATGVFTPTVAGYYQFSASIFLSAIPGTAGDCYLSLRKGATEVRRLWNLVSPVAAHNVLMTGSCLIYANGTTDTFSLQAFQSSGSPVVTTTGSSYTFSGFLVRAK